MLLREWMTEEVEVVAPQDDVASVMARLRDRGVGQFPVVSDGKLIGMITEWDACDGYDPHAKVATVKRTSDLSGAGTIESPRRIRSF